MQVCFWGVGKVKVIQLNVRNTNGLAINGFFRADIIDGVLPVSADASKGSLVFLRGASDPLTVTNNYLDICEQCNFEVN